MTAPESLMIFGSYLAGLITLYTLTRRPAKPKETTDTDCPHVWGQWQTEVIKVKDEPDGSTVARNFISTRTCDLCNELQVKKQYIGNQYD